MQSRCKLTLHSLYIGANDCTRWEAVENQAHNDCKALKQGMVETSRVTWDTVIMRQANVSSSLGVYSPPLCEQRLLLAVEVKRVCPEDNKSAAVWMLQACLLRFLWHCRKGRAAAGNLCCHLGWKMPGGCMVVRSVYVENQAKPRGLASFKACFLLWVKQVIQKPGSITAEIAQVLLALFAILPPKTARELGSARAFKGSFIFYELLDRTE